MQAEDADVETIRTAKSYQPALWLVRLAALDAVVQLLLQLVVRPKDSLTVLLVYVVGMLALLGAYVLLNLSGVLVRHGLRWHFANRPVLLRFLLDLLWLGRR